MLSKNKIKYIVSLQEKKVRDELKLFSIEGDKLVREFLNAGIQVESLFVIPQFLQSLPDDLVMGIKDIYTVNNDDLKRISTLKSPHNAIAVIRMPAVELKTNSILDSLCLALDVVQDPGNFGTIIRTAAWFGIKNIVCSTDCVDVYNQKVIQSSMGAIIHTNIIYTSLPEFFSSANSAGVPVYGALLEGNSIYESKLSKKGIILLGNESKGISESLKPYVTHKIKIPKMTTFSDGIDSLNVSMAAAIICSEFTRQAFWQ